MYWKHKYAICVVVLILAVGGWLLVTPAAADTHSRDTITFEAQGYDTVTVRGVQAVADFWVKGPGPVEMTDAGRLRLHYTHADVLDASSTMTVRLNGHDIASRSLATSNGNEAWFDAPLPAPLINAAFNHVQIVFFMRHADAPCTDPNDPSLWVTIFSDSGVEYPAGSPLAVEGDLDLASFPAPFYHPDQGAEQAIHMALPETPTTATLTAATSIAARLGQAGQDRTLIPILHSADTPPGDPAIVIGPPDALPWLEDVDMPLAYDVAQKRFVEPDGTRVPRDAGVLQMMRVGGTRMLLVTGVTDEALLRAGHALSSRAAAPLLTGEYTLITEPPALDTLNTGIQSAGRRTFGKLTGLDSDPTVRGYGRHFVNIPFTMPQTWQFEEREPRVTVHFSHAAGLDDRSLLTVEVNGTAIGSTRLDDDNATNESLQLSIPSSVLQPGTNALAVTFDMYLADSNPCARLFEETAWGTVHRDSTLTLPYTEAPAGYDLSAFAAPFVRNGVLQETSILLPPAPSQTVISQTLAVAMSLGKRITSDAITLPTRPAGDPTAVPDTHLIIVTPPYGSPLLDELKSWLPVHLDAGGTLRWQGEDVELLAVRTEEPMGLLQMGDSPWHDDRTVLLVSGTSAAAVGWAANATTQESLTGNVAGVTEDGRIATLSLPPEQRRPKIPPERRLPVWGTIGVGIGALIVLAITIIVHIYNKREAI